MSELRLPDRLNLVTLRSVCARWPVDSPSVHINFSGQGWVFPSGTVGLSCLVEAARSRGQAVTFDTHGCQNVTYWQRMGFFGLFNAAMAIPPGARRPPNGRFSEIRRVGRPGEVDEITEGIVAVTRPDKDSQMVYSHIVSEALNNVCQHSGAVGFCASQYYERQRIVRFCIADHGRGLRQALAGHRPVDDADAIRKALQVGVSGRSRAAQLAEPKAQRNRGVGLSAIHRLLVANDGKLVVWSGEALYQGTRKGSKTDQIVPWQGTLLAAMMPRNHLERAFGDIMLELARELQQVEQERQRRVTRLP